MWWETGFVEVFRVTSKVTIIRNYAAASKEDSNTRTTSWAGWLPSEGDVTYICYFCEICMAQNVNVQCVMWLFTCNFFIKLSGTWSKTSEESDEKSDIQYRENQGHISGNFCSSILCFHSCIWMNNMSDNYNEEWWHFWTCQTCLVRNSQNQWTKCTATQHLSLCLNYYYFPQMTHNLVGIYLVLKILNYLGHLRL